MTKDSFSVHVKPYLLKLAQMGASLFEKKKKKKKTLGEDNIQKMS